MTTLQRISRTELARNTRRVLTDVQRGRTALIESHGEAEAALLDIVDYWILRAVMHYYAELPGIDPDDGLDDDTVLAAADDSHRYALVFAHYLAGSISLARAAELLRMPWIELRTRCQRLDVPLRTSPADTDQAADDMYTATQW